MRRLAAIVCALPALMTPACTSNMMYFGTGTTVGAKIGAAGSSPTITVGVDRVEYLAMPLAITDATDGGGGSFSCKDKADAKSCKFIGTNGGTLAGGSHIEDSYSVLASFGLTGNVEATNPKVSGQIAQYFSSGVAAQIMAITGGAAIVSLGEAAQAAVTKNKDAEIAALLGQPGVQKELDERDLLIASISQSIKKYEGDPTTFQNKMSALADSLNKAESGSYIFLIASCNDLKSPDISKCLPANMITAVRNSYYGSNVLNVLNDGLKGS